MTVYHATGTLYIKSANAAQATTLKNLIQSRIGNPALAFANYRNFNYANKEVLPDGTLNLTFSLRFKTNKDMSDNFDAVLAAISGKVNLAYFSTAEYHICHHDEGVQGDAPHDQVVQTWGTYPNPVVEEPTPQV